MCCIGEDVRGRCNEIGEHQQKVRFASCWAARSTKIRCFTSSAGGVGGDTRAIGSEEHAVPSDASFRFKEFREVHQRDEGGQTCGWRLRWYHWEKERSSGHVHQLQWDPDGFCVLPSCSAAHEHKVEKRNSEFQHISHSLFSKYGTPYAQSADITVWLGDLNYRLEGISSIPARKMIEENRQSKLRGKDQLLQEAEKGEVFNGYCEGTLSFKPTYKYDVGSSIYDTSSKIRVPSWTDRILFKVGHSSGLDAVLSSYESLDCVRSSDHKPVKAHLCLRVRSDGDAD
ncbi:type IV inositol polyphosphate 5-phosphatase 11-like isoform X2 [Miscanthus floridulus]|uniref:type IV inositol polyphosphate 5-phosphatase 11-like isoform X2 n=1 Tax=Miscanthus floridulus TaxID=154761 RepID=UPI003457F8B4